jgi:tetratricopeptide (TPR) repeat protein
LGLGAILCEILTGVPPFAVRGELDDALARLDACRADVELVTLARDCLNTRPDERPSNAQAVANRVTGFLTGVQERLRAAELARAEEAARAAEATRTAAEAEQRARAERRARRLQVGLAAALLVLTAGGGLGSAYLLEQHAARIAHLTQVFAEATALRDKARRDPGNPALWREALAVSRRVEDQHAGSRYEALRAELEAGLNEAERDATLRHELVAIRASERDLGDGGTDAAYADAFQAAGLDLDALGAAEFARRLRLQSVGFRVEVSAHLDEWSGVRRSAHRPVAAWRLPIEAARLADPDPYRDRLRVLRLAEKRESAAEALTALVEGHEAADLPAPTSVLLARMLLHLGRVEQAAGLLRTTVARHPDDVWANYDLGRALDRMRPSSPEEAAQYYTAARALRPETAHELAHLLERMGRSAEAADVYRDLARRRPDDASHLVCLGFSLKADGHDADAAPVLDQAVLRARAAIRLKPDDPVAYFRLGSAQKAQGKLDDAIAAYRESIRLDADAAGPHFTLGDSLAAAGKHDEAIAAYREAMKIRPDYAAPHASLGDVLKAQGKPEEAIAAYREASRLAPNDVAPYLALAALLKDQGKLDEAIVAWREVIRLRPDNAAAHFYLGNALRLKGEPDRAIAALHEAIRLKPDSAPAHNALGLALRDQAKTGEAIAAFREAIRLKPDDADHQNNLANALESQGKTDEAVVAYREAIRLRPTTPGPHYNLAMALATQGKADEAAEAYREAIRLRPDYAEAHCNLGLLLVSQGDYAGGLALLRRGHELGSRRRVWRNPSAQWIAQAEQAAVLAARLPAVLNGEDQPHDDGERMAFADICRATKRYAASARLWREVLEANPKLGVSRQTQLRFTAARSAVLAAAGAGGNDPPPDADAKSALRSQALHWLRAEHDAWSGLLDRADAKARLAIGRTLRFWQSTPDLSTVRDPDALAALPQSERAQWQSLWADVDALLVRAEAPVP